VAQKNMCSLLCHGNIGVAGKKSVEFIMCWRNESGPEERAVYCHGDTGVTGKNMQSLGNAD
jgi:hypothetical protein